MVIDLSYKLRLEERLRTHIIEFLIGLMVMELVVWGLVRL
jgi:hypothetical protein